MMIIKLYNHPFNLKNINKDRNKEFSENFKMTLWDIKEELKKRAIKNKK